MEGVFMPRPIKDLAIVGLGQSCMAYASWMGENPGWQGDVWTVNAGALAFQHDVVFDMHTEEYIYSQHDRVLHRILERRKRYETYDRPVVMPKRMAIYPTSMTYPLKMVIEATKTDYFANGMAYMLAMAWMCNVERIYVFGADFIAARGEELIMEDGRACMEYWLGRLVEKGTQVLVTDRSPVLGANTRSNRKIYGYHEPLQTSPEGGLLAPDYTHVN